MTSPLPLPAGGTTPNSPASPARSSVAPRYTHLAWLNDMAPPAGHIAGIYADLEVMAATLREVRAGRTHLALVDDCLADGHALFAGLLTFVAGVDAQAVPMFEAIQRAGGQAEVAEDKRYHDRT